MDRVTLARAIDQTLLSPKVGMREGLAWISDNAELGFASLCVSPFLVPLASQRLAGTATAVCSVVAFPLGYAMTESKAEEAAHLVELGCAEVDMVMNVAAFLEGEDGYVTEDIAAVVRAVAETSGSTGIVKVILETGYLEPEGVVRACRLAERAGAHFVKTSTGFGPRGASVEDVVLMHEAVGGRLGVKASGGVRDTETALAMLEAGATRIGASAGAAILDGLGREV